jgi:hypothetical protein
MTPTRDSTRPNAVLGREGSKVYHRKQAVRGEEASAIHADNESQSALVFLLWRGSNGQSQLIALKRSERLGAMYAEEVRGHAGETRAGERRGGETR